MKPSCSTELVNWFFIRMLRQTSRTAHPPWSGVFVSTGYGTGAAVIELTPDQGGWAVREVWRNIRMKNQFTSSVLHDGFIYGLDESILACVDAATGELKWKGGRYGYGQVMLAGGHLFVLTEGGDLALVRATPERHDELRRFPVLDGKTWNHPAMSDGILLVRNGTEMAAFDLRPDRTARLQASVP
jgi:outer membrane protein assembly factor BamB